MSNKIRFPPGVRKFLKEHRALSLVLTMRYVNGRITKQEFIDEATLIYKRSLGYDKKPQC